MIEQENDAGENIFLFKFYYDEWDEYDWENIIVSGIDINRREYPIVRSGGLPYYIEGRIPPKECGDLWRTFERLQIDYYDPFEMVMRSRGVSQHDNCYVGRTPNDKIDLWFYKCEGISKLGNVVPNLPCGNPDNDFHPIVNNNKGDYINVR